MEKKRRKIVKGKVENWKCNEENLENEERTFFFFFFFAFHFSKPVKFVLGLPKWKCSILKKRARQKIRKKWLCPLRKIFLLCPCTLEEVDSWICLDVNIYKNLSWNHLIDSITKSTTCNSSRAFLQCNITLHQCCRKTKELCYIHDLSAPHCWVCQHHMESSHS